MKIQNKIRKAIVVRLLGKRLFGIGKDEEIFGAMTSYGTDQRSYNKLKQYKGFVYTCINLLAEQVASYEPVIYKKKGDTKVKLEDHDFLKLLKRPTGTDPKAIPISMFDLLFATAAFIELQGECYWFMAKGMFSGKVKEIVLLRADKVGKKLDKNGDIEYFFVRSMTGEKKRIEINEMLPFIGFDPRDPYKGLSTVEAGKDYILTDEYASTFTKNFFKNNAGINGVLSLKGNIVKAAFKKFVRAWREKYEGVDNAGKVAIIRDSDASFEKVGLGLDELDMSALRKMSQDDIAKMFRIPMPLLGKAEESGLGRANVEALEYIFAKYTIEPKLKKLDAVFQAALERFYDETELEFSHENIIPADKEYELNRRDKAVDRWQTRNEIREQDGLDDATGGDDLRAPFNTVPLGSEDSGTGEAKSIKIKIHRKVEPEKAVAKQVKYSTEQKENFRLSLMRNQALYERRYKRATKPILKEQHKEVLVNLEAKATSLNKDFNEKLFDDAAADQAMLEKLAPVSLDLSMEQGAIALVFAGDEDTEFKMTNRLRTIVSSSTYKMAKNFNDETLKKLNETLAVGIAEGEGIGKLKARVASVYKDAEGYRAERIARTETLKASNHATVEAYRQTGYVKAKAWVVNPDACPQCLEFEGKEINLDDNFLSIGESYTYEDEKGEEQTVENTYEDIESPPLHPNCRCTIIPIR